MNNENIEQYKEFVLKGSKSIYNSNLVDFGEGNVSMRIPNKEEFVITPTRNDYATIDAKDIVHLNFVGLQISKGRTASSEYRMHSIIYQKRPRVNCIVHTHSVYATILSILKIKIPILLEEMLIFLGGEINIADYNESGTYDIGINAINSMESTNAVLMTNHGALVVGRNMESTVKNANLLEKLANILCVALKIGNVSTIKPEKWPKFLEYFNNDYSTY